MTKKVINKLVADSKNIPYNNKYNNEYNTCIHERTLLC